MNALDKEGRSPLLLAGARSAWKSVIALIGVGSNISLRDNCRRNLFHHIVLSGGSLDQFIGLIEKAKIRIKFLLSLLNYPDLSKIENSRARE